MLSDNRIAKIANEIVDDVLSNKDDEEVARWEQEAIDAEVFPTIQKIEDAVDLAIGDAISKSFNRSMTTHSSRKWWEK